MKAEYRYAHDDTNAYAASEDYFPPKWRHIRYSQPSLRRLEGKIAESSSELGALDPK
ncbi:MAG: Replication-associated recombination protein A [Sodalis sp.]|nr:MAG: Replication-associated recombination protein A [Sodalis sp.]